MILLRDVTEAPYGAGIESLGGVIEASGLPLSLGNLPAGQARLHVYYSALRNRDRV